VKDLPRFRRVERAEKDWIVREIDRDFELEGGPVDGLTDEFLNDVAPSYAAAVERGERPNVSIQKQVGYVSLRTVQRWVDEDCRRDDPRRSCGLIADRSSDRLTVPAGHIAAVG
jgi:hypothetical protein